MKQEDQVRCAAVALEGTWTMTRLVEEQCCPLSCSLHAVGGLELLVYPSRVVAKLPL